MMQEDYTPDSEAEGESFERHKSTIIAPLYEESEYLFIIMIIIISYLIEQPS